MVAGIDADELLAPAGTDLQGRRWAVGGLAVIDHPRRIGATDTVSLSFVEVLVSLDW